MDDQLQRLVNKVWDKLLVTPLEQRLLIGIAGIPGSGKTTLTLALVKALNARHAAHTPDPNPAPIAAFVPMDGFHLTRAQLSAMPDPAHAHARRGAEFTFDGTAFLALVQALRQPLPLPATTTTTPPAAAAAASSSSSSSPPSPAAPTPASSSPSPSTPPPPPPPPHPPGTIFAPAFSHARKDPVPDALPIAPTARVVVVEGAYVALARAPWRAAAALLDELWFVAVDAAVARRRLAARHVRAGLAASPAEGARRADANDLPNGADVLAHRVAVHEVVRSCEDGAWAAGE